MSELITQERIAVGSSNLIILTLSEKKISAKFQPRVQLVPPYTNGQLSPSSIILHRCSYADQTGMLDHTIAVDDLRLSLTRAAMMLSWQSLAGDDRPLHEDFAHLAGRRLLESHLQLDG